MSDDDNDDPVELPSDSLQKAIFMLKLEREQRQRFARSIDVTLSLPKTLLKIPTVAGSVSAQSAALVDALGGYAQRQRSLEKKWHREFQQRSTGGAPANSRPLADPPKTTNCSTGEVVAASPEGIPTEVTPSNSAVPPEPTRLAGTFRRNGKVWTISFQNRNVHLVDSKGLRYLAELVRAPHKVFSAATLAGKSGFELVEEGLSASDDKAVRDVKARMADIEKRLRDVADSDCDQMAKLKAEHAKCALYLRKVQGRGGKIRKVKGTGDRSRTAVANALRRVFRQLEEEHPVLALHFQSSINTGSTPSYKPSDAVDWQF